MFAMIFVLINVVYLVMLFSLRINLSSLHMLSHCLRLIFYLVLMNCTERRLTLHLRLFREIDKFDDLPDSYRYDTDFHPYMLFRGC
jgi:hypothetical protein